VIDLRRPAQHTFGEGLIAEETTGLWEPWMRQADRILEDEQLIQAVQEALLKRRPKSRTRGRRGYPAEIVLRMLLLKHIRNWSFGELEREVRPNLVYREFTRIGSGKVPDAKALGRQAQALDPKVVEQIHRRVVELAVEHKVVQGRKMRVDTTVCETNIHYPTDSSLLGDGDRVLTRLMKKVTAIAGAVGTKVRDSMRNVQRRVAEIARVSRAKGEQGKKVIHQTKERIFGGNTHVEGKILSVFETTTEVIRKGKASKPTEFGKMIKIQEAENQIVIDFAVYDQRPSDSDLLIPAIETHQTLLGRTPDLAAADAAFYSAKNVAKAEEMGVKRVSVPNRSTKSAARKQFQKQRWFKKGQKWRTGCEGRISLLKRRHGLRRSLYKKDAGIKRWVGLGVIADNLINLGKAMGKAMK